ncbi:hypothetical protein GOP47_0024373 [Adiantum capillus-veneris]|uniref:DDE Tnp4 domain-containing protein n=1 Tax=Adiantum capillus-veneris TaxID=13818 RepID=A0A9D4U219_ADICA|nr:hypothetical protein GOP47_0024373 [Adiantum capillus-veneris]
MHLPKNEINEAWYDRYGNDSMIVQGTVDDKMWFLDINIGWPGSCNDKQILHNSRFYRLCQGRERLLGPPYIHDNLSMQEYIVGDGGYGLFSWLAIAYPRVELTSTSHCRYNFLHSSNKDRGGARFRTLEGDMEICQWHDQLSQSFDITCYNTSMLYLA